MEKENDFRDSISTVDKRGKRIWVYPKKPSGKFHRKRVVFTIFLLTLLFAGPHIRIDGEPLLLFNIIERKFVIFGKIFWPQDFHLFALAMVTGVICITLFTVIYGRLFCGWACPQTVFMEMVFRKIEYLIEGDWKQQQKLKKQKWDTEKLLKKTAKHLIFWGISFLIANTFLAYIIGSEALWDIQVDHPSDHLGGLVSLIIFTTIFYLVFAKLREQVCTTICPYGRLQGVLLDSKSIVVAYDHKRGEKDEGRAKFRKNENRAEVGKGDCIDCSACVHVCPTGIDIRNGTQLECTNCTACIDACGFMMEKVDLKKGLIRYVSEEGIRDQKKFQWTNRTISYTALLIILLGATSFLIATRSDYEATIYRQRGTTVRKFSPTQYSNTFEYILVNKTNENIPFEIKLIDSPGEIKLLTAQDTLLKQKSIKGNFVVIINKTLAQPRKNPITIGIYSNDLLVDKVELAFMGPLL
jgi:cytochrome c oxidase accessory protein FixG